MVNYYNFLVITTAKAHPILTKTFLEEQVPWNISNERGSKKYFL